MELIVTRMLIIIKKANGKGKKKKEILNLCVCVWHLQQKTFFFVLGIIFIYQKKMDILNNTRMHQ